MSAPSNRHYEIMESPIGRLLLVASDQALESIQFAPFNPEPEWDYAGNPIGGGPYHQPSYPLAFVAVAIQEETIGGVVTGQYHHGTDVLSANNPDAENHLWVLTPNSEVKKNRENAANSPSSMSNTPSEAVNRLPNNIRENHSVLQSRKRLHQSSSDMKLPVAVLSSLPISITLN